jgi:hemolysin activation/secretion protein
MSKHMTQHPFTLRAGAAAALAMAAIASSTPAFAQPAKAPSPVVPPSTPASAPRQTFQISEVQFSPTTAVSTGELQQLAKPFLNRPIDSTDLSLIAAAIRRLYDERGFGLAGVGFPNQDLSKGVLQIAIVEPRISRVEVVSPTGLPVSMEKTNKVLQREGVVVGAPMGVLGLDRAMFTLNDWPGVSAKATLMPAGDEGSYNVTVQTERRRWWDASIDADNYGSKASGRYRIGTLLRWNNPTGNGDNLDLRAQVSNNNGTTVGRLGYEVPIASSPWRFGVGVARVNYELGEQFEGLGATGSANVFDASVSYPFIRSRDRNLIGRLSLTNKGLTDDLTASDKHVRAAEFIVSFEARDTLLGGAFNGGTLGLQFGKLTDDTSPAPLDTTTVGNFTKFSARLTRLQALTRTLSFFIGLAGQRSSRNLDNAEKFSLGGADGVRAYPSGEGSVDEGLLLNTELRLYVNPQWSGFAFFDNGNGKVRKTALTTDDGKRHLHGAGLGLQYVSTYGLSVKASLGVRGDEVPLSETDQSRTRLLMQVQQNF